MVIKNSKMKRKRRDCSSPLLDDSPKRTKVHAQRKFAQGSNVNSPVITPVKEIEKQEPEIMPEPVELLPIKRPNTEDFLTFLCFRGTPILPPSLNFFNTASIVDTNGQVHEIKSESPKNGPIDTAAISKSSGSSERPFIAFGVRKRADPIVISKQMDKKRRHALALQALRRKYQEQRMAKIRAVTISKLSETKTNKTLVRSNSVSKTTETVLKKSSTIHKTNKVSVVATKRVKVTTQTVKTTIRPKIKPKMCLRSFRGRFIQRELQFRNNVKKKPLTNLKKIPKPVPTIQKNKDKESEYSSDDHEPLSRSTRETRLNPKVVLPKVKVAKKSAPGPKKPSEINFRVTRSNKFLNNKITSRRQQIKKLILTTPTTLVKPRVLRSHSTQKGEPTTFAKPKFISSQAKQKLMQLRKKEIEKTKTETTTTTESTDISQKKIMKIDNNSNKKEFKKEIKENIKKEVIKTETSKKIITRISENIKKRMASPPNSTKRKTKSKSPMSTRSNFNIIENLKRKEQERIKLDIRKIPHVTAETELEVKSDKESVKKNIKLPVNTKKSQDSTTKKDTKSQEHTLKKDVKLQETTGKNTKIQENTAKRDLKIQENIAKKEVKLNEITSKKDVKTQEKKDLKIQENSAKKDTKSQDNSPKKDVKIQDNTNKKEVRLVEATAKKVQETPTKKDTRIQDNTLKKETRSQDSAAKKDNVIQENTKKTQESITKKDIKAPQNNAKDAETVLKKDTKVQDTLKKDMKAPESSKKEIKVQEVGKKDLKIQQDVKVQDVSKKDTKILDSPKKDTKIQQDNPKKETKIQDNPKKDTKMQQETSKKDIKVQDSTSKKEIKIPDNPKNDPGIPENPPKKMVDNKKDIKKDIKIIDNKKDEMKKTRLSSPEFPDSSEIKISQRPTRKTKEAAAIYMEILSHKLVNDSKIDDDSVSIDSFPELPNVKRTEQRENELKAKAKSNKSDKQLETINVEKNKAEVMVESKNLRSSDKKKPVPKKTISNEDDVKNLIIKDNPSEAKKKDNPGDVKKRDNPSDTKKNNNPSDVKKKDNPADIKKKDNPIDIKKKDNPVDIKKKDNPIDIKKKDNPVDIKKKDNPVDIKKKENPVDIKKKDNLLDMKRKENPVDIKKRDNPVDIKKKDNPGDNKKKDNPVGNTKKDNPGGNTKKDNPGGNIKKDSPIDIKKPDNPGDNKKKDNSGVNTKKDNQVDSKIQDNPGDTKKKDNPSDTKKQDNPDDTKKKDNPGDTNRKTNPSDTEKTNDDNKVTEKASVSKKNEKTKESNPGPSKIKEMKEESQVCDRKTRSSAVQLVEQPIENLKESDVKVPQNPTEMEIDNIKTILVKKELKDNPNKRKMEEIKTDPEITQNKIKKPEEKSIETAAVPKNIKMKENKVEEGTKRLTRNTIQNLKEETSDSDESFRADVKIPRTRPLTRKKVAKSYKSDSDISSVSDKSEVKKVLRTKATSYKEVSSSQSDHSTTSNVNTKQTKPPVKNKRYTKTRNQQKSDKSFSDSDEEPLSKLTQNKPIEVSGDKKDEDKKRKKDDETTPPTNIDTVAKETKPKRECTKRPQNYLPMFSSSDEEGNLFYSTTKSKTDKTKSAKIPSASCSHAPTTSDIGRRFGKGKVNMSNEQIEKWLKESVMAGSIKNENDDMLKFCEKIPTETSFSVAETIDTQKLKASLLLSGEEKSEVDVKKVVEEVNLQSPSSIVEKSVNKPPVSSKMTNIAAAVTTDRKLIFRKDKISPAPNINAFSVSNESSVYAFEEHDDTMKAPFRRPSRRPSSTATSKSEDEISKTEDFGKTAQFRKPSNVADAGNVESSTHTENEDSDHHFYTPTQPSRPSTSALSKMKPLKPLSVSKPELSTSMVPPSISKLQKSKIEHRPITGDEFKYKIPSSPSASSSSSANLYKKQSFKNKLRTSVNEISPITVAEFPKSETLAQLVVAPTYYPSEKEFQDPIEFIEKIRIKAEQFGICRIVPPSTFKPECKVTDDMRFTAYNQYVHKMLHRWGPNFKELMAIKKYLSTQNISLTQPPWIGGMEIDLPRLYQTVQSLGGLKEVIEKKKWPKVSDLMKIPKSAQDRVTKLDDIYCKYLLPYDTLSPAEREKLFDEVETEWAKRESKSLQKSQQNLMESENESEIESDDDEAEECIVKGRGMALNAFYRIARNTMSMWFKTTEPSAEEVEQEFWKNVTVKQNHICVHSGSIDSGNYGYGFAVSKNSPFARHAWNLKVFTNNSGSVLRSMGPIMGVTVPTLHVGMVFSSCCWYRDPHSLPWIEYLHTGGNKIWYGIPDSTSNSFKTVMKKLAPNYCRNKTLWLPSDTVMVPPNLLVENGVSLSRIVQEPGQFIVVFPKVFTSCVSTGYIVSESVYFAPPHWLNNARQVFDELRNSCEPSMFSLDRLLLSIINDSRTNADVLKQILPVIQDLVSNEKAKRVKVRNLGVTNFEKLPLPEAPNVRKRRKLQDEDREYECEICRMTLFISLVMETQDDGIYCLEHAAEQLDKKKIISKNCKLMLSYDDEELNSLPERVTSAIEGKLQKKIPNKYSGMPTLLTK